MNRSYNDILFAFAAAALALIPLTAASQEIPVPLSVTQAGIVQMDGGDFNCVSFVNTSDRPIVGVEFAFDRVDPMGRPMMRSLGFRNGLFSPGILIEGPNPGNMNPRNVRNCFAQNLAPQAWKGVQVALMRVYFAGGGEWYAPGPGGVPLAVGNLDYGTFGSAGDMQKVVTERGRPCRDTVVDDKNGRVVEWSYDCDHPGTEAKKDLYRFRDGKLEGPVR